MVAPRACGSLAGMGLPADLRLAVVAGCDLRGLPLTPDDFFVYSRIEALARGGATTVAEVVAASGQGPEQTERALERLLELGALTQAEAPAEGPADPAAEVGEAAPEASRSQSTMELRKKARARRKSLLGAQMRSLRERPIKVPEATSAREQVAASEPPSAEDSAELALDDDGPPLRSILERIGPVAADDGRLDEAAGIPLDQQRRLLALRDRLRSVGHFEILGLEPVDDPRAIRRAYHVTSRQFHPDAFYGRELGSFRGLLDLLFRRVRASYEFLLSDERRRSLVAEHRGRTGAPAAAPSAAPSTATEARTSGERRQAQAATAATSAHLEQAARAERDRERQQRVRDRILDQRRQQARERAEQARERAEQARAELEAGRSGAAASLFRLAHDLDPENPEYKRAWQGTLASARRERATASHQNARQSLQCGRTAEAARLFAEAADADPTLRHLADAAAVVADFDAGRARGYAMAALEALQQAKAHEQPLPVRVVAHVHRACARAFLAAGQTASAREQAERAHQLAPSRQTRTLLNATKVT